MGIFSHDEDPDWNTVYSYKNRAEKYKSVLEKIKEIVISAIAKQRPYKEDFTEIETIINEVLK